MIRKALPSDSQRIAEINVFGWRNAYRGFISETYLYNELTVKYREERYFEDLSVKTRPDEIWVFEENGIVKGYMAIGDCRDEGASRDTFELMAIYVDPLFQRRHIGSALAEFCVSEAARMNKTGIVVWVFEKNNASIEFYKKMGFVPDGGRKILEKYNEYAVRLYRSTGPAQTPDTKPINLFTERLLIRDMRMDDLQNHHELISDNTVMLYLQDIKTNTVEESRENLLIAVNEAGLKNRRCYFWGIEDRLTDEFIGEIGYTVTQETPCGKLVHLGYFIKEAFWNKGFTSEAVKRVIKFAFEEDNVYRIHTGCAKENVHSEKIMQKCGFTKEADFKEFTLHEGKLKDRVEYRLLKREWEKLKF